MCLKEKKYEDVNVIHRAQRIVRWLVLGI